MAFRHVSISKYKCSWNPLHGYLDCERLLRSFFSQTGQYRVKPGHFFTFVLPNSVFGLSGATSAFLTLPSIFSITFSIILIRILYVVAFNWLNLPIFDITNLIIPFYAPRRRPQQTLVFTLHQTPYVLPSTHSSSCPFPPRRRAIPLLLRLYRDRDRDPNISDLDEQ